VSIDPNNLAGTAHVTFDDEFNNLSLWNGSSGTWSSTYWYQDTFNSNGASLPSNGEQEWYINSNYGPTAGIKPWTVSNGVLTLTATPTPSWLSGLVNNYSYVSGELNTYHSFAQTYGYFEMRAQLPAGQGFWPAFWLMPEDGSWPPELDIVEALGQNPTELVTTSHSNYAGMQSLWTSVPNMTTGYHTYGVDWEPDYITWFFDGQKVYQIATPADMNKPMYIIANVAVGGNWPGPADGYSSAQMNIDYIRAYASGADGGVTSTPSTPSSGGSTSGSSSGSSSSTSTSASSGDVIWQNWAQVNDSWYAAPSGITNIVLNGWNQGIQANNQGDTFYSTNSQNSLFGGTGNDTFYLGRAGDNAASGGGTDTFVFQQVPWVGGHIYGFGGQDVLDLAFLQTYGYWGSNPIADGRVALAPDGAGGTQVWVDLDGLSGVSGTWLVTTLDGVSPSSLAWQNGHLADPPAASTPSSGGSTATTPSSGGQTFWSDNNGDHWTGTSGNDIFNLGRGGDYVTGAGGGDTFKFAQVPWAHAEIADFSAQDLLDLTGMFASVGYTGSNPLQDGHLKFASDGNGGTAVWFDTNGLPVSIGSWEVVDLDHVAPSSLGIGNGLVTESGSSSGSSSTSGSSTSSGSTSSSGGTGQSFWADNNGDWMTGTSGDDTFNLGRGGDHVLGNGGADTFKLAQIPWAHAEIYDFHSGDLIDLSGMFASVGYSTSNPVADGRLWIGSDGSDGTQVWFDADGLGNGAYGTWQLFELDHVNPSSLHVNGAFISA
jgi:beta-glucanase (GH16 family)